MDVHDELDEMQTEEPAPTDRRGFFGKLRNWSAAVLAGVVFGSSAARESRAGIWVNRRGGGGGWANARGGGSWANSPGGGGWLNRRGIGGWLNARR